MNVNKQEIAVYSEPQYIKQVETTKLKRINTTLLYILYTDIPTTGGITIRTFADDVK